MITDEWDLSKSLPEDNASEAPSPSGRTVRALSHRILNSSVESSFIIMFDMIGYLAIYGVFMAVQFKFIQTRKSRTPPPIPNYEDDLARESFWHVFFGNLDSFEALRPADTSRGCY